MRTEKFGTKKRVKIFFYYTEIKKDQLHEGNDVTTIIRRDILCAMNILEPEKLGFGSFHYHGLYVIDPRSNELYGVMKIIRYIVEKRMKRKLYSLKPHNAEKKLDWLGFDIGKDKDAKSGWKYNEPTKFK